MSTGEEKVTINPVKHIIHVPYNVEQLLHKMLSEGGNLSITNKTMLL